MPAVKKIPGVSPGFVRKLIKDKGHTYESAAEAIGISVRSMWRYVGEGDAFRHPPLVVLVALKGLSVRLPSIPSVRQARPQAGLRRKGLPRSPTGS